MLSLWPRACSARRFVAANSNKHTQIDAMNACFVVGALCGLDSIKDENKHFMFDYILKYSRIFVQMIATGE